MNTSAKDLLSRRGISLDRLSTLVIVADKGSIAAAAGKTNLTRQSQFSRQLKELESCFEHKLTERRGRTLTLTEAGQRLATIARAHFLALNRFASESAGKDLAVRIGAGESILNWLTIPALARLETAGTKVQWQFFNLQAEEIQSRLLDQRLDFGILRSLNSVHRLKSAKLGQLHTVLFVPRIFLKSGMSESPALVSKVPLALLEGPSGIRSAVERECRKCKRIPHVCFECTSAVQIASIVASGLAAGLLPAIARHLFDHDTIAEIPLAAIADKAKPLLFVWNPRTLSTNPMLEQLRRKLIADLAIS